MLSELRVRDLGVIADLDVVLHPGLTAITGETGAGKTLIVEAIELLVGGRADVTMVRSGAEEAVIEGRFEGEEDELVVCRVVPHSGRSRAFLDGRMAPLTALEESGRELVDLYGQHAHQSLLRASVQRAALDGFAGVDLLPVRRVREELADLARRLEAIGGDARDRQREADLLAFELGEIDALAIAGPDEEALLEAEEEELAHASALRGSAEAAYELVTGGSAPGALDLLGEARGGLVGRETFAPEFERLAAAAAELSDVASELRRKAERLEDDPARLSAVLERRQALRHLIRKHGENLADVLAAAEAKRARLAELEASEEIRAALEAERAELSERLTDAESVVGDVRRRAAGGLASAIAAHLHDLGLPAARLEVLVAPEGIGDEVEFLFGANPGEPALPLAKVASGGELARAMLALRLVCSASPPTLVFDEVDAGVGGEAALAVGRALSALGRDHQVLVVTHLAQVAAHADHQVVVEKSEVAGRTVASLRAVEGEDRLIELSRMLSGQPDSEVARRHAAELLETASRLR